MFFDMHINMASFSFVSIPATSAAIQCPYEYIDCIYVYLCIHVYVYICIYVYMYIFIYAYLHVKYGIFLLGQFSRHMCNR